MTLPFKRLAWAFGFLIVVSTMSVAYAADIGVIVLFKNFRLHNFDSPIIQSMGAGSGSVLYIKEMADISEEEQALIVSVDRIGCFPFYFMRDGEQFETGYNCRSFYCVGYTRGPKQCKDIKNRVYNGVAEIKRRLDSVQVPPKKMYFTEFLAELRTDYMSSRITRLDAIKCKPYYLVEFNDTAVAEGYECEEAGEYPYYSAKNNCIDDWNDEKGYVCTVAIRENEYDIRLLALGVTENLSSSSSVSSSGSTVSSSASSAAKTFSDLRETNPAYGAIMSLAARGVVSGYADGTFRPANAVNRAEWLKLFMTGMHADAFWGEMQCFPDVTDQWFASYVCAAKRLLWVKGYADGRFRGDIPVNRAEAIKMLVASLDVKLDTITPLPADVPVNIWFAPYVRTARSLGILSQGELFYPSQNLTRADAAVWIEAAMQ
jgi:hypothetical protein